MIKKIESQIVRLPTVYLIENEEDFKQLPKGLPYIIGKIEELKFIKLFLEFQVLYRSCLNTNLPIKWVDMLSKLGYKKNKYFYKLYSGGEYWESQESKNTIITMEEFINDSYYVNLDRLQELKILPKFLDDLKKAIETNIIDEIQFNPLQFNKQMNLPVGYPVVKHNMKNLLILDVSRSMPTSVIKITTQLCKTLSKKFYADVIITGGQSFFIDYDDLDNSDFVEIAKKAGRSNESMMFIEIMKKEKHYNTCISFGDDDRPWEEETIKNCKMTIESLISLHTNKKSRNVTGYVKHFKPKNIEIVKDWITYIDINE